MVNRTDWLPRRLPDQLVMFTNFNTKIGGYQAALALTAGQVTELGTICTIFIDTYNFVEQQEQTMQSLTEWRQIMYYGEPIGDPAPVPPAFGSLGAPVGWTIGIITRFREVVDLIKRLDGYTEAIGEDLMIVGAESIPPPLADMVPDLKVSPEPDFAVKVSGSLQSMDSIRIEYKRKGAADWSAVGFFTRLPGEVSITPANGNDSEAGHIRARFMKNNSVVGNYSPEYAVTVS